MVAVWEMLVRELVTEVAFEVHRSLATASTGFVQSSLLLHNSRCRVHQWHDTERRATRTRTRTQQQQQQCRAEACRGRDRTRGRCARTAGAACRARASRCTSTSVWCTRARGAPSQAHGSDARDAAVLFLHFFVVEQHVRTQGRERKGKRKERKRKRKRRVKGPTIL